MNVHEFSAFMIRYRGVADKYNKLLAFATKILDEGEIRELKQKHIQGMKDISDVNTALKKHIQGMKDGRQPLELVCDLIMNPSFVKETLDKEKENVRTHLKKIGPLENIDTYTNLLDTDEINEITKMIQLLEAKEEYRIKLEKIEGDAQTAAALDALGALEQKISTMERRSLNAEEGLSSDPIPPEMRNELAQLYGDLEKMVDRLDDILTDELHRSGRDAARAKRKELVKTTNALISTVHMQIKRLDEIRKTG